MPDDNVTSPFHSRRFQQAMNDGFTPLMLGLLIAAVVWFIVLCIICYLRDEPPCWFWQEWFVPSQGNVWNLLILAPAGLAAGNIAGFILASYGSEQQRLGHMVKAVPALVGGAAAADVLRGHDSYLVQTLDGIADVCGRDTSGGLVFLILLSFFAIGFLAVYVLKAAYLNPLIAWASPQLFHDPADAAKAAQEGIGRDPTTAPLPSVMAVRSAAVEGASSLDPSDPQKGQWGGKYVANGFMLFASVTEADAVSSLFKVHLFVRSIEPAASVDGPVIFHLHPTFIQPVVRVEPVEGVASLDRLAWGAFTVGALLQDGTKLELDLSEPADFPTEFRSR